MTDSAHITINPTPRPRGRRPAYERIIYEHPELFQFLERGVKGINPHNPAQEWDIAVAPDGERWAFFSPA